MSGVIQPAKQSTLTRYFVGYSTQTSLTTGVRTLYDIPLINVDLMNAFNTRVGERVMRPDYGCKLWDYLMEPLTTIMHAAIIAEVQRICDLDSRLITQSVDVTAVDQGFSIAVVLVYLPWNVIGTFTASFENADAVYFSSGTALR